MVVTDGKQLNNSDPKLMFSDVKVAKKEWKRCHKHIYLERNVFKAQRRACTAHDTAPRW